MKKKTEFHDFPTVRELVGQNVYLRATMPEDYEFTYRWFLTSDPQSQTCHEVRIISPREMVERMKTRQPEKVEGDFIIVRIEDEVPVGKLRFMHLNLLNRSCELGYIIDPREQGKGYAKEGLRLLIAYLFTYLNLNKVYAQTASFNKSSVKLLESLGFRLDGTLRQHHYYKGNLYDDVVYSLLKFECDFLQSFSK
jgi:RimJ/RimL family protein N-acetyltransferase